MQILSKRLFDKLYNDSLEKTEMSSYKTSLCSQAVGAEKANSEHIALFLAFKTTSLITCYVFN